MAKPFNPMDPFQFLNDKTSQLSLKPVSCWLAYFLFHNFFYFMSIAAYPSLFWKLELYNILLNLFWYYIHSQIVYDT